ncbi:hypothetical protein AVEN_91722-1 [Araneus ventricosus]|uniref:Uncharacterized protein n=1 Tax=Araneus ventricosus TaxID=182803 RepID=A0A4Y2HH48_ARAVE|nr:hypothetical protein AVEN_91722-1 [Araneus ventricosus]
MCQWNLNDIGVGDFSEDDKHYEDRHLLSDSEDGDTLSHQDESSSDFSVDEGPQPFSQSQLNDLVRDLGLSKGPRLKNKNLLTPDTSFSWNRHREKEFTQFFSKKGNLNVSNISNDVQGLKKCFDVEYDPSEWRLFIHSSKKSLKAVLLHNGNSRHDTGLEQKKAELHKYGIVSNVNTDN